MPFELSNDEGKILIRLARKSILIFLDKYEKPPVPLNIHKKLLQKRGVFVTLNNMRESTKELRGCIGYPNPILPLAEATITSAINSATKDPRFPPILKEELKNIVIEISVLTPPELLVVKRPREYLKKIVIGKDGLIVERGQYRGLLLPQVPVEWRWDVEEFLVNCCLKARLPPDAWLIEGTKIYKFSCIIARELSPNGVVKIFDMRKPNISL